MEQKNTKVKKPFVFLIVFLIPFIAGACVQRGSSLTDAMGGFRYPNTDWNMTANEFFDTTKMDISDFEVVRNTEKTNMQSSVYTSKVSQTFQNRRAKLEITFMSVPYSKKEYLSEVVVDFEDTFDQYVFLTLCEELQTMLQEQDAKTTEPVYSEGTDGDTWQVFSLSTTDNFPEEVKLRLEEYYQFEWEKAGGEGMYSGKYTDIVSARHLTQLRAIYFTESKRAGVRFSGTILAQNYGRLDAIASFQNSSV